MAHWRHRICVHPCLHALLFIGIGLLIVKSPLVLGEQADLEQGSTLSTLPSLFVRRFHIEGNTVLPDKEVSVITGPYENREITAEELQAIRKALTHAYIRKGYITSGMVIPDQKVVDGIITLQAVEGRLSQIEIEGNRHFRIRYIAERLRPATGPPVNVTDLQGSLYNLKQDPRIARIDAQLIPDVHPGDGILKVHIEEKSPYVLEAGACNCRHPSIGPVRTEIHAAHGNLTGNGDMLEGRVGFTEGSNDMALSYAIPVTHRDTMLKAEYRKGDTLVIEEPFGDLDIKEKEQTLGVNISHPLYRRTDREFTLSITFESRHSTTYLLGKPFSFYPGQDDGRLRLRLLRLGQQWSDRGTRRVVSLRSLVSTGLDSMDYRFENGQADSAFVSWLGQMQWVQRLGEEGYVAVFRFDIQLANDPLLPCERFAVGGMHTVRGYRESRLVRDNGTASSIEFRIPILDKGKEEALIQIAPFLDFGRSWNSHHDTPSPKSLMGIGIGILLSLERLKAQVYGGIPLRKFPDPGDDLQDKGIHVQVTGSVW